MHYESREHRSRFVALLLVGLWALIFVAPAFAQEESTTADTSSASPNALSADPQAQRADTNNVDAFRCEFFLHVVRDDQGNVRRQYQDDELVVRRVEQCLSEDVLKDTIVNRKLPDTGGAPLLLVVGSLAIALAGAGLLVSRRR